MLIFVGLFPVHFVVTLGLIDFLAKPTLINLRILIVFLLHVSQNVFFRFEASVTFGAAEWLVRNFNNFHDITHSRTIFSCNCRFEMNPNLCLALLRLRCTNKPLSNQFAVSRRCHQCNLLPKNTELD